MTDALGFAKDPIGALFPGRKRASPVQGGGGLATLAFWVIAGAVVLFVVLPAVFPRPVHTEPAPV